MSGPGVAIVPLDFLLRHVKDGDERGWSTEFAYLISDPDHGPRVHALADSIREDGIREPIVIGPDDRVWDGHHRLCAAMHLGHYYVPVTFVVQP